MPTPRSLRALLPSILFSLGLLGCREDAILPTDLLPDSDNINTTTVEIPVSARSVLSDSAITAFLADGNDLSGINQGIGNVSTDPFSGRTTAGLYFSVVPPAGFSLDTAGMRIDSAVLVLPYAHFSWGDTSNAAPGQRWRVYRVTDDLLPDSFYHSNRNAAVDRSPGNRLGEATVYRSDYSVPRFIAGAVRPAHLRIRLDTGVISSLLRSNPGLTGSAAGMRQFFKGFFIEPDANQTASTLAYFRFGSGSTIYDRPGMVLYYRTPARDTGIAVFSFNADSAAAYTYVKRTYNGSPAYNLLFGTTGEIPENILLLQNRPGAAIDVRLKGLRNLPKAVYAKAQIILTKIDTLNANTFTEPERIFPFGVDSATGRTYNILDSRHPSSAAALDFIDGRRRSVTVGGLTITQYVVNVPRELQEAISKGKSELHLRLNGATPFPAASRLVAGGTSHNSPWRIRTSVAYLRQ